MADISKITLPSGNTYDIKDAVAREMIAGGISFIVAWDGTAAPVVANVPAGVKIIYNGTEYTGTLSTDDAQLGAFYLVKSSTQVGIKDVYDEYVVATVNDAKVWEKLGDTQIDLSDVVTGVALNKSTDVVLGEATTFALASGSVSHGTPTKDEVLGSGTTFTLNNPTVSLSETKKYVTATASGTAVGANGTAAAVTGYPNATTDTFVKSVTAETNKSLVTTSITPAGSSTSVINSVTDNTSKLVTTTVPNVTGNTDVSVPVISSNSSVTANKSTWSFTMGTGTGNTETLVIGGGNGSDVSATNTVLGTATTASKVTLGTAKTVATGSLAANGSGDSVMTSTTTGTASVATVGSAVTVATGATDENGTGDSVVTGVTIGSSASALTGLGTPSTATALTGVKVTSQPTVSLSVGDTSGTGKVEVVTDVPDPTVSGGSITVGTNDKVNAVTAMPTSTVGTSITVGTNDKVTTLTGDTSITVTKGS